jgi:hypothetical protein
MVFIKKDIIEFWNWFGKNEETFYNINEDNSKQIIDSILSQLRTIQTGLEVEISVAYSNGIRDLILSAAGDKNKFRIVQSIAEKAPKFNKWRIIAFRQRAQEGFKLIFYNVTMDPSQIYCLPIVTQNTLDLIVYINGYKSHDENLINYYCIKTMDSLIGEYDCVMSVRNYNFRDISEMPKNQSVIKLKDFPDFLDNFKKEMKENKKEAKVKKIHMQKSLNFKGGYLEELQKYNQKLSDLRFPESFRD